jgi:anti-sigma B factor antagonist
MAIWHKQLGNDLWLVKVDGRFDQSQTAALESQLNELLDYGRIFLIIDLTQTTFINSGGLRCLVSAWRKARQQNGDLVLAGLNNRLQEVFNMVGFDKVFQIYPDYQTAQQLLAMK